MWTWNCSDSSKKPISLSETWQNEWIIKQTVVLLWKFWRRFGSVSYLFSCTIYFRGQDLFCFTLALKYTVMMKRLEVDFIYNLLQEIFFENKVANSYRILTCLYNSFFYTGPRIHILLDDWSRSKFQLLPCNKCYWAI